jgi:probable HAF family extracellular repeat protein
VKNLIARFLILTVVLLLCIANGDNANAKQRKLQQTDYVVTNLGSLGGSESAGNSINNRGWITGTSFLDDAVVHATLWKKGKAMDLGTLGGEGTNSAVVFPVKNKNIIAGISQTDIVDPNGERWSCSNFIPFIGNTCVGFVWKDDEMNALPTLGGPNGFAAGVNNEGQIAGWAENLVVDPSCDPTRTQKLQFRAVVWGPDDYNTQVQELLPYQDDPTSAATGINDDGLVVGISGTCDRAVGGFSAAHAVYWENGTAHDMGNIGGDAWNTPMAVNNLGEVTGFANLTLGRAFNAHAFRWSKEDGISDLGVLTQHEPGISQGLGINKHGQIVGMSCKAGFEDCRAVIWENGVIADLNTRVPGYTGHLIFANDINDDGVISGQALADNGDLVAFRAVPEDED